jgi:hypothetical protein
MAQRPSYVSIPGSDQLVTGKRGASAAAAVESSAKASLARVEVQVGSERVVVGPALLHGAQVPLLLDVTDRLGPLLSPEAFVVYLQLYRLAAGDGKNACRVGLRELGRRTGLQGRRLNKAVADAVFAGALLLVDRTRDGTLYRVRLPAEFLDGGQASLKPTTTLPTMVPATTTTPTAVKATPKAAAPKAKAVPKAAPRKPPPQDAAPSTLPAPAAQPASGPDSPPVTVSGGPRSVGDVCRWFAAEHGSRPGRSGADVASAVMALLESGHTFAHIPALLSHFVKAAPQTASLRDVERWLP